MVAAPRNRLTSASAVTHAISEALGEREARRSGDGAHAFRAALLLADELHRVVEHAVLAEEGTHAAEEVEGDAALTRAEAVVVGLDRQIGDRKCRDGGW